MEDKTIEIVQDQTPEAKKSNLVTKKFLIIALAVTVLVNAALSAGMLALFAKKSMGGRPDMPGMGRPGSEMFQNGNQNGGSFTPPEFDQNTESGD